MRLLFLVSIILFAGFQSSFAQKTKKKKPAQFSTTDAEQYYKSVEYRLLGPFRGGRSCTVAGVEGQPQLYYFGATGGGVWKTKNGGQTWENISDGFFGGSIGAIAVSSADPNVIYVGGGEQTLRGNVSSGYGIWKSVDAGMNWESVGLKDSKHISRIRIHPSNPDIVYVSAIGNIYKPNHERGVFKSIDGGKSWKKTLFVNNEVGAADLIIDPNNPRLLYATTWRVKRTPYDFSSGGEGSGIWKSTDSGETWENISDREGLPDGPLGISGITVSPANSQRIWAIIEAKDGGIFRSDDGGKKWKKINSDRGMRQRAWYYSRIYADPQNEEQLYVMNVQYFKSQDGGKTFKSFNSRHSDHHDLWIAPEHPDRMIIANDGGAQVSFDGGKNWSTYQNQPTSQFYRLTTDTHFPYRIYAAQQDNSTVRIPYRTAGWNIDQRDWESTAGGESAHIAPDPNDPEIVYGGSYDGFLTRKDHRTGLTRAINVWPDNPMGHGAEGMKYRFQWNFPIFFSPHNPKKLYTASNHLHLTTNEGQSWETISPDLTRNDSTKLKPSGGPITKDNTSVEYYCTIFAAAESPRVENLLWVGSDDGLIHVSKNGGKDWDNVTPNWPDWMMVNAIEPDPFNDGGCYVAGTRYKLGDFSPYVFCTKDFGKTWKNISSGIKPTHFTRVIRSDFKKEGLLYAGTESGMYVSHNDGGSWSPLQLNLPIVPITDIVVKEDQLIVATQGRSLWVIDDLNPIRETLGNNNIGALHIFTPKPAYRMPGGQASISKTVGRNHASGVQVYYYVKELKEDIPISIEILKNGEIINTFATDADDKSKKLKTKEGANVFNWNLQYEKAEKFDKMILWWASLNGPKAVPGTYIIKLCQGDLCQSQSFEVKKDPRSTSTQKDFEDQFSFITEIRDKMTEAHEAIQDVKDIRNQMTALKTLMGKDSTHQDIKDLMTNVDSVLTDVEKALYQTKNQSNQDPLNFPIRLTNKLGHLNALTGMGDYPPTDQAIELKNELVNEIDDWLALFNKALEEDLPNINEEIRNAKINVLGRKPKE